MNIIKPVGVIIQDKKYLVARDGGETFFKNVGGRTQEGETDTDALKRHLATEIGFDITDENPKLLFDFPPTPAQGDPGDFVILRGYLIAKDANLTPKLGGKTAEVVWINTQNQGDYTLTPQITDLILPKLKELRLID